MRRSSARALVVCLATVLVPVEAAPSAQSPARANTPRQKTPSPTFEYLVEQVSEAQDAGRLDDAASLYVQALELKPSWTEGRIGLVAALYWLKRCDDARPHLGRLPRDGVSLGVKGLCESQLAMHDEALADLREGYRLGIDDPAVASAATFQLALLLNRAGSPDVAFDVLKIFAAQGKESPAVIAAFGVVVLRLPYVLAEVPPDKQEMVMLAGRGGYDMARGRRSSIGRLAFEELVSRYPTTANVHYAFGTYLLVDDPEGAIEEFRKELRLSPEHYQAMLQIAAAETKGGNAEAAVPIAERAVRLAPDAAEGRLVLGRALLETGQTEHAVEELERAATLAPENPDVQFSLARAYQRAGRADDAARARAAFRRLGGER